VYLLKPKNFGKNTSKNKKNSMNFIKKIASSSSVWVFADQAITSGTTFLLTLFLAQKLDNRNFGTFSVIVLISYLVMSISNALLIQPFQVSISKIIEKKQYQVFLTFGLFTLSFLTLLLIQFTVLFLHQTNSYRINVFAIGCFIIGFIINDFFRKLFLGLNKTRSAFIMDFMFLFIIVVFFCLEETIQLPNALWIIGLSNLITALFGLYFIVTNYEYPVLWKSFLSHHFTQGKWLFSVALLQWCSSNFFVLISGIYLGIEALGALRLVQSFFGILNLGLQTVENYYLPKVAGIYNENSAEAKKYLLEITLIGALFFTLLLTFFFVFSNEIIVLAGGHKYQNYGYVVRIISVLYLFIFLSYPVRIAVRILVLNKIFFFGYLLSFASSLLSFHFLLNSFGLYGAVSGLIINQIIMILFWQNQLKKNQFQLWK
jgi:O-antigen/teichoic acid export membrane protein